MWVNAGHGRDFYPLADHMTKFKNFTKEENCDFSAFQFSLHFMLGQALTNLIGNRPEHNNMTLDRKSMQRFHKWE